MFRLVLAVLAMLTLTIGFAGTTVAQDLDCDDFSSQAEAQSVLNSTWPSDPHRLDGDSDGWACEVFFGGTGSVPNATNQGSGTENGDDSDTSADTNGSDTVALPSTGVGSSSPASTASLAGMIAALALIAGGLLRAPARLR